VTRVGRERAVMGHEAARGRRPHVVVALRHQAVDHPCPLLICDVHFSDIVDAQPKMGHAIISRQRLGTCCGMLAGYCRPAALYQGRCGCAREGCVHAQPTELIDGYARVVRGHAGVACERCWRCRRCCRRVVAVLLHHSILRRKREGRKPPEPAK